MIAASDLPSLRPFIQLTIIANRPEKYLQYFEDEGLNDIEYPVSPIDIPQIEQRLNISINLFSYFDDIGKARHPMYISRHNSPIHIDLLYFNNHYAWIKDFSRLFADLNKHNGQAFYCKRCLGHFQTRKCIRAPPAALHPRGLYFHTSHPP